MHETAPELEPNPLLVPLQQAVDELHPTRKVTVAFGQALIEGLQALNPTERSLPYAYALTVRSTLDGALAALDTHPLPDSDLMRAFHANERTVGACDSAALELALRTYGENFMWGVRGLLEGYPQGVSSELEKVFRRVSADEQATASITVGEGRIGLGGLLRSFLSKSRL